MPTAPSQIYQEQQSKGLNLQLPSNTYNSLFKKHETIKEEEEESSSSYTSNNKKYNLKKNINEVKKSENKIVEIYSNDNDNIQETTMSDTLVQNKKIHSINSLEKKLNITDESTSEEKEQTVSETSMSDAKKQSVSKSSNISEEKKDNKSVSKKSEENTNTPLNIEDTNTSEEDTNTSEEDTNTSEDDNEIDLENIKNKMKFTNSFLDDSSEESEKNKSDSTLELEQVLENLKDEISESDNNKKDKKYDLKLLNGMKLKDLQNLIKEESLSLDKKINGVSKKKTKQELIDELCQI